MDPVSSMAGLTPAVAFRRKRDRPSIGLPLVSHPLHTMPDNRKHRRSGPDVDRDRTREHIVEISPSRAWRNALDSKVVAVSFYVKFGVGWSCCRWVQMRSEMRRLRMRVASFLVFPRSRSRS